jgi:UDP-N-acetyl-D-mannosaminuronate dehydrogenase
VNELIAKIENRTAKVVVVGQGYAEADAVVVPVDHPEFDPGLIAEHSQLVSNTKNLLCDSEFTGETL